VPISQVKGVYIWAEMAKSILFRSNNVEALLAEMVPKFRSTLISGE
jgi:hypothetical protein